MNIKRSATLIIILVILLMTVTRSGTDLFLPALPAIVHYFGSTPTEVQLTITLFFVGLCTSQWLYGPLSDRYGRKPIALAGLAIFMGGALLCAFAPNIELLIVGRFISGIGLGCGPVLIRSMTRDTFSGMEYVKVMNLIGLSIVAILLLAPLAGSYIQHWIDWRADFYVLTTYALMIFILFWLILPETNPQKLTHLSFRSIRQSYRTVLKNKLFMSYVVAAALSLSGLIGYLQLSPFIFETDLHYTVRAFGLITTSIALAYIAGSLVGKRIAKAPSPEYWIKITGLVMIFSGFLIAALYLAGIFNIYSVLFPTFIYISCFRIIMPYANAKGLGMVKTSVGSAAAVFGITTSFCSMTISYTLHLININTPETLGVLFVIVGFIILIIFSKMPKPVL